MLECSGVEHHISNRWQSGVGRTHDTIALDQRADSRLSALLHIRSHIFLPIAIVVGLKFILEVEPGLGGRRALRLQLLEKDEYFPATAQYCTSGGRDELYVPFSSGAAMFNTEVLVKCCRKLTQVKHEPGVLERRSSEPKTSCGGADMMVECKNERDWV